MKSSVPTSPEGRALYICSQVAALVLALFFVGCVFGGGVGWLLYSLNYPEPITGAIPSSFPVMIKRAMATEVGNTAAELVSWEEWERCQRQGTASVWVENGSGQGRRTNGREVLYTYRMSEEGPQRYMVSVSASSHSTEIRAQYRVEGNHVIPVTFRYIHGGMMIGVIPIAFIGTLLFGLSLRAFLRWYTRSTGREEEIRQLMGHDLLPLIPALTLQLLVGYYLFLGGRRALCLVSRRS